VIRQTSSNKPPAILAAIFMGILPGILYVFPIEVEGHATAIPDKYLSNTRVCQGLR